MRHVIKNIQKMVNGREVHLTALLIFIISLIYFLFFNTSLFFCQEQNSLFIYSSDYLAKYLSIPGGFTVLSGNFLAQFYFSGAAGSIIISSLTTLYFLVLRKNGKLIISGRSFPVFLILFPACLLLLLQKSYNHFIYYTIGYLSASLWFLISVRMIEKKRFIITLVLFPLFYYLSGSFFLLFLGTLIVYLFSYNTAQKAFTKAGIAVAVFFSTWFLFRDMIFLQPAIKLWNYPFPPAKTYDIRNLEYLTSLYFILFPLIIKANDHFRPGDKTIRFIRLSASAIIILSCFYFLFRNDNQELSQTAKLERYVIAGDWDKVIRIQETMNFSSRICQYYYNLALSEKGELCSRLFYGRQDYGGESLSLPREKKYIDKAIYFYYANGLINEVHHLAVESVVTGGYKPENLRFLIISELLNGSYNLADRHINILKRTLYYRKSALEYEKLLSGRDTAQMDLRLKEKKKLMIQKDFFIRSYDLQNIDLIISSDPANRIAFEYKMARLLFEKDLVAVTDQAKKMKDIGYEHFPEHIEEALLQYVNEYNEMPDTGGLTIINESDSLFKIFKDDFGLFIKGDRSESAAKMKEKWSNTYWYYYNMK